MSGIDRRKFITTDEYRKLLSVSKKNPVAYMAFLVTGNLGLRVSELVRVRCCDIDEKLSRIRVFTAKQRKATEDYLPLDRALMSAIVAYARSIQARGETLLFPYSTRWVQMMFDKYAGKAGIKVKGSSGVRGRGIHCLRHFRGMSLVYAGIDPVTVKELLRHRSITSTDVYLHSVRQEEAVKKVGTIE